MRPPKYPSTPHSRFSLTVHRDDTYHPDEETFLNKRVVITEKIDGGNTCLFRGEVYARSIEAPSRDGWMAMVRKWHAHKSLSFPNHVFNGEDVYGVHSIKYEPLPENKLFYLFCVRTDQPVPWWRLSWDETEAMAEQLGVPTVPVRFRGVFTKTSQIEDWFKKNLPLPSELGGECEGFVLRVEDGFDDRKAHFNVVKFVRPHHVQTDQHWRKNWQKCPILRVSDDA